MNRSLITIFVLLLSILISSAQSIHDRLFVQDVATQYGVAAGLPKGPAIAVRLVNETPVAYYPNGAYRFDGAVWSITSGVSANSGLQIDAFPESFGKILAAVDYRGGKVVGTSDGLFMRAADDHIWKELFPQDGQYKWAPVNVSVAGVDANGSLWFGAEQGVGMHGENGWQLFGGKEGLPYNRFTCFAAAPDGSVWLGTEKGAIRYEGGEFYYRHSRRWLPDDFVNDIAVASDGTVWIATNEGVSRIERRRMNFADKSAHFIKVTEARNHRMGFISPNRLEVPYDISTASPGISDNDGKYTSMYGAALAYRYAVTGDLEAKALADRSLDACIWLTEVTHEPGFPARVIIPKGWPEPLADVEFTHQMNLRVQQNDPFWKDIKPRFVESRDGNYLWKCDTSSDELAGHFFFYGIYFDLVAKTDEEIAKVRKVTAEVTDHLIRNGFFLRDFDGEATRWGNFSPEFLNSVWGWDQRGLNSMMMLSFLNVALHVTGDMKYDSVAQMLRTKHQYHINAMHAKEFFPPENVVPWDNNLSLMSLYGLINYEQDPELLIMYRLALEYAWLHISKQQNAFWDAIYLSLVNKFNERVEEGFFAQRPVFPEAGGFTAKALQEFSQVPDLKDGIIKTLRLIPLDLLGYRMDNTHRLDIEFDPTPGQKPTVGWKVGGYALNIDERGHVRQDRDGFALVLAEEGGGRSESEGTFFLLPYYMALYHGLID